MASGHGGNGGIGIVKPKRSSGINQQLSIGNQLIMANMQRENK
jgi:hypothetical protein